MASYTCARIPTLKNTASFLNPITSSCTSLGLEARRSLYERHNEHLEHKIKCIIHYFERVCSCTPTHFVSFERKILPLEESQNVTYPNAEFWGKSSLPLYPFEACKTGLIEDHLGGALEVDFANKNLGGGALRRGCVQEEIRFMINPELIADMLFLPTMSDNEAIEIVRAERYSDYTGYSSTFRFSGDYVDKSEIDSIGRRKTRIVAIDAVRKPGKRQYQVDCLLSDIICGCTWFLALWREASYYNLIVEIFYDISLVYCIL